MALLIGVPVAGAVAHDGWFVRVCRAKTEADRIHLAFSGGRQGYSWSWIKGQTPDEIDLPHRFYAVPPYLDLDQAYRFPGSVAVLITRMIRRGRPICG